MNKKFLFVGILIVLGLLSFSIINAKTIQILDKEKLRSIKGMDLITDLKFKNMFIDFIYEDSKPDFKKIYPFLSRNYLTKRFPAVKNVQDYLKEMSNAERSNAEYIEILKFKRINKARYMVDFSFKTMYEGNLLKVTDRYFFVFENNVWKYDGLDANFLKNEFIE